MKEYRMGSGLFTPSFRQMVEDLTPKTPISYSETINIANTAFIKDGAGSKGVASFKAKKILDLEGGRIGSFWGRPENLQYEKQLQSVVVTDGSATFTIHDGSFDLEKLFESVTKGRYLAKVYDNQGRSLYGWIGGVTVSGNDYTFDIYNSASLGTQNWFQGGATAFGGGLATIQIYKNTSSVTFGSTDTFTEEVPLGDDLSDFKVLSSLSDGQYAINYEEGLLYFSKLNADDTEAVTYKTFAVYPFITSADVDSEPALASLTRTPGHHTITIGAGATALNPTTLPVYRFSMHNPAGNSEVYVGASTVLTTTGQCVYATGSFGDDYVDLNQVYVIGTPGQTVRVFYTK